MPVIIKRLSGSDIWRTSEGWVGAAKISVHGLWITLPQTATFPIRGGIIGFARFERTSGTGDPDPSGQASEQAGGDESPDEFASKQGRKIDRQAWSAQLGFERKREERNWGASRKRVDRILASQDVMLLVLARSEKRGAASAAPRFHLRRAILKAQSRPKPLA
jgi:hypothetical protein